MVEVETKFKFGTRKHRIRIRPFALLPDPHELPGHPMSNPSAHRTSTTAGRGCVAFWCPARVEEKVQGRLNPLPSYPAVDSKIA